VIRLLISKFAFPFEIGPDIAVVSDQIIKVDTTVLNERKRRVDDIHAPPFDDLRNYAFEGAGSTAGSLSSVLDPSGTKLK
jgi:Cadherin cytoplasmic region